MIQVSQLSTRAGVLSAETQRAFMCVCRCLCVCVRVCVYVCLCVCEREREREGMYVCMYVCMYTLHIAVITYDKYTGGKRELISRAFSASSLSAPWARARPPLSPAS